MSTKQRNLEAKKQSIPSANGMRVGIVVSEYNEVVTGALKDGAVKVFLENGVKESDIITRMVPGSFELPLAAQFMLEYAGVDVVVCVGSIVQGETRHFEFISNAVSNSISRLNLDYGKPVIFCVLTPDTQQQALDRAGGKLGNKGEEAAIAALKMFDLETQFDQCLS